MKGLSQEQQSQLGEFESELLARFENKVQHVLNSGMVSEEETEDSFGMILKAVAKDLANDYNMVSDEGQELYNNISKC